MNLSLSVCKHAFYAVKPIIFHWFEGIVSESNHLQSFKLHLKKKVCFCLCYCFYETKGTIIFDVQNKFDHIHLAFSMMNSCFH